MAPTHLASSILINLVTRHVFHDQNRKAADHRLYPYQPSHQRQEQSIARIVHTNCMEVASGFIDLSSFLQLSGFTQIVNHTASGGMPAPNAAPQQNARKESQKLFNRRSIVDVSE